MVCARTSIQLGAITAANMLLWFLFQGYIVLAKGPGHEADAFFASFAVPQLLATIANSSLMHVLVPFFSQQESERVSHAVYALLTAMTAIFVPIAAVLYMSVEIWAPLIVAGFPEHAKDLTVQLTRLQILGLVFTSWTAILIAACHARQHFARAELAPCVASLLSVLALLVIYPAYGVTGAAWLMAGRGIIIVAFLLPNFGWPAWNNPRRIQAVWHQVKPLLASSAYYKSDQLFDRYLTSQGRGGDLSTFYMAQQIHLAASAILGKALCAPILPILANHAKAGAWSEFTSLYRSALSRVILVALCCYAALVLMLSPALELTGRLHHIAPAAIENFHWLTMLLVGVLTGGMAGLVLVEAFFAMGNTRAPAIVLTVTFTAGLVLKAAGFFYGDVKGLAVATSLFCFLSPLILLPLLERELRRNRRLCPGNHGFADERRLTAMHFFRKPRASGPIK